MSCHDEAKFDKTYVLYRVALVSQQDHTGGKTLTKSSTPQPSAVPQPPPKPVSKQSWGFLVLIFRLLLLGVGGILAVIAGIAIAQFQPAPKTQDPPLVEKVTRSTRSLWSELQRMPETLGLAPIKISPSPSAGAASPAVSAATPPLSEIDKQKLQVQLTQLQSELAKLKSQPALSEGDRAKQAASIQEQIRIIQQQLSPTAPVSDAPIVPPTTSKVSGNDTMLVTLPTDSLFAQGQTSLQSGAGAILDSILIDLQRYPGATIRISAHTDIQDTQGKAPNSESSDRAHTFEQATAIEQYLAGKLGDKYHWTVAGYGHSQPLVDNSNDVNRQRNRRIEIAIEPQ